MQLAQVSSDLFAVILETALSICNHQTVDIPHQTPVSHIEQKRE